MMFTRKCKPNLFEISPKLVSMKTFIKEIILTVSEPLQNMQELS